MAETSSARSYEVIAAASPEALVVTCGDPRFQKAFEGFIREELHLEHGQYIPLVVGGGGGPLGRPMALPKEFKFMKDLFELYRHKFPSIRRVVLINHEDCGYYASLKDRALGALAPHLKAGRDLPREDLKVVADVFERLLHHLRVQVELYYARYVEGDSSRVAFEPILKP